jgi:hypothetical protein
MQRKFVGAAALLSDEAVDVNENEEKFSSSARSFSDKLFPL